MVDRKGLAAGGAAHRQLVAVAGGGDHERPEGDADDVSKMHTPTRVAADHHGCEGVDGHRHRRLGQHQRHQLAAGGWTATADDILTKVRRGRVALNQLATQN